MTTENPPRKFDFTNLTEREIRYEIPALLTTSSATALCLPTDRLDEPCTKCIEMMLSRDDVGPRIEELHLTSHGPQRDESRDCKGRKNEPIVRVIHSLKDSTCLKKLVIADVALSSSGISAVASILYDIKSLSSLVLRQCGIDYRGATKISCALASNRSVASFDFSNNPIGSRGASSLCVALEINTTIKKLKVSGTSLGIEGAVAIASALTSNSSLEVLDLSRNQMGDLGASKIALALKSNKTLQQISLRQNLLSDVGALCVSLCLYDPKNLDSMLHCNHSIRYLNLNHNEVSRKCMQDIEAAQSMNLSPTTRETVRRKVARLLNDESKTACFGEDITVQCMPHLISALGSAGEATALFNVLRRVHMPVLFEQKPPAASSADSLFSSEASASNGGTKKGIPAFIKIEAVRG